MLLFPQSGMPRRGRDSDEEGGSRKRQRPGLSVQDAAASRGLEESRSILEKKVIVQKSSSAGDDDFLMK